jgi:hypothetical protein
MENAENPQSDPRPQPDVTELQEQFESLYHLVVSVLVLLIVVSGTLLIFILGQYRAVSRELEAIQPNTQAWIAQYHKVFGPQEDAFIKKLVEFGGTNADFQPVLARYGLKPPGLPGAAPMAPAPSPGQAAPGKK